MRLSEMVEAARQRLPLADERLLQADIEALPFAAESFDAVAATGVLEYARSRAALAELVRVLRPGGVLVVSYPNPHALYGIWKSQVLLPRRSAGSSALRAVPSTGCPAVGGRSRRRQFAELLAAHGLEVESVEHSSYLALPTPLDGLLPAWTARVGATAGGRADRAWRACWRRRSSTRRVRPG